MRERERERVRTLYELRKRRKREGNIAEEKRCKREMFKDKMKKKKGYFNIVRNVNYIQVFNRGERERKLNKLRKRRKKEGNMAKERKCKNVKEKCLKLRQSKRKESLT